MSAFAVSWRRREGIAERAPAGVATAQRPMPARPLHAAWAPAGFPPLEWFIGDVDVVHGSNFVVPPTRRAARVVTVHDLTVVRYPELCDPPTLAFPRLVRRAVAEGAWVHTPSAFVAAEVVAELGVDPGRVRAVHHGVPRLPDGTSGVPGGARHRVGPGGRVRPGGRCGRCGRGRAARLRAYVLAVGTVEPRKDYPLLVRSFADVAAAHPDVALVVVGGDGWGAEAFGASVAASPVRDRVVRAGTSTTPHWPPRCGVPPHSPTRPGTRGSGSPRCRPWRSVSRWWRRRRGRSPRWSGTRRGWSTRATPTAWRSALVRALDGGDEVTHWSPGAGPERRLHLGALCRRTGRALPGRGVGAGTGPGRAPGRRPVSRLRVLLLAEQLRRSAAGGIGTYVLGLLQGLDTLGRRRPRRPPPS